MNDRTLGHSARRENGPARDAIVEAARQLLKELPPGRLSVSLVARAAGVDPSMVRDTFGALPALLSEVGRQVGQVLEARLARAGSQPGLSARARLRERVGAYLDHVVEYPHHYQILVDLTHEEEAGHAGDLRRTMVGRSLDLIAADIAAAGGAADDAEFGAVATLGMLEFFVTGRKILGSNASGEMVKTRYADFVADLILGEA